MIEIDNRVGSRELLQFFPENTARLKRLEFADFAFVGNGKDNMPIFVGIERKTIPDLVNSIHTGRLAGYQAPGLYNSYNVIYIVVEGTWRENKDGFVEIPRRGWRNAAYSGGKVKCSALLNFLNTLDIAYGFHVRSSATPHQTASLVLSLYQWWTKDYSKHHAVDSIFDGPQGPIAFKASFTRKVACQLPRIGWEISGRVEERFGSVENMLQATIKDWQQIPGIGKVTAEKAYAQLRKVENRVLKLWYTQEEMFKTTKKK